MPPAKHQGNVAIAAGLWSAPSTVDSGDSTVDESYRSPYLDRINVQLPNQPARGKKNLGELIEEWKREILSNRKLGGARASLSHIRTYITPLLGEKPLHELNVREHQVFVTSVGRRVDRRKTAENIYGTLTSILNKGRKWGYFIPEVKRQGIEFLTDEKPKDEPFFFDANTAARVINAAPYPFKVMFLVAAICGLRIGEVTALKVSSLDFERKLLHITAALDYATRKESTPKSHNSEAPLHMPREASAGLDRQALQTEPGRLSLPQFEGPPISIR